jgi:hypothetical protein
VNKLSSTTKPFLATWVAKTQTGWVHKNGDWWNWSVKYANGITHTNPKCIEGACPGAPAAGGAVLLITAK